MDEPSSQRTAPYRLALPGTRRTRAVASSLAHPQGPEGSEGYQWIREDLRELQTHRRVDPPQKGTTPAM
jgi:hypothetical protein